MKKIKPYDQVKVGDIAMENPEGGSCNKLGEIVWKGTWDELFNSEYYNLTDNWELDEDEDISYDDYDLVVVLDYEDNSPTLFNYYNDPCGCVVFE